MHLSSFALLTDENIHPALVTYLRSEGFTVKDVKEENLIGSSDRKLLSISYQENLVVLTHDSDFGKIIFTKKVDYVGIIYLRPGHFDPEFHKTSFNKLLQANLDIQPPFIIVAENKQGKVKIRLRNKL